MMAATMSERVGHDWAEHILDAAAVIAIPKLGVDLHLTELYKDLDFSETPVAA